MSNQPNQPTPKSAEEVLTEFNLDDSIYRNVIIKAMQTYASQFARYVPDDEIEAMWPIDESDRSNPVYFVAIAKRNGAKAMRDMIFGGVKP